MIHGGATIQQSDWVSCIGNPGPIGSVKRVAKNGSWADVDWGPHVKRMPTRALKVETTITSGGFEITDITRQREIGGDGE